MYTAMIFLTDPMTGMANVRALRAKPYRDLEVAKQSIIRSKYEGYVKQVGHPVPVWHNLPTH